MITDQTHIFLTTLLSHVQGFLLGKKRQFFNMFYGKNKKIAGYRLETLPFSMEGNKSITSMINIIDPKIYPNF